MKKLKFNKKTVIELNQEDLSSIYGGLDSGKSIFRYCVPPPPDSMRCPSVGCPEEPATTKNQSCCQPQVTCQSTGSYY